MIAAAPFRSETKPIVGQATRANASAKARGSRRGRGVSTPKSVGAGLNEKVSGYFVLAAVQKLG